MVAVRVDDSRATEPALPPVRKATPEEGMEMLERAAQRYLGIGAEEFIHRWYAGYYAADPDRSGVMDVAMLLSFVQDNPLVRALQR